MEWYEEVFTKIQEYLYEKTGETVKQISEKTQSDLEQRYDQAYERIKNYFYVKYRTDERYKGLSNEQIKEMAEAEAKKWIEHHKTLAIIVSVLFNTFVGLAGLLGFLLGGLDTERERGQQLAYYLNPIKLPDIFALIDAYFKERINRDTLIEIGKRLGYSEDVIETLVQEQKSYLTLEKIRDAYYKKLISLEQAKEHLNRIGIDERIQEIALNVDRPLLSPEQVKELYLREVITEDEHDYLMSLFGFTKDQINRIKTLYYYIPSVSDLVRMAVREAFSPETIQRFGMDQDYPKEFEEWAKKQGLSPEWAKRYWYAHWELPSLTMGYEMFHRGIINEDELKLLMKAQDVMPFWRDKLIQLSYNPFTRVDVRRMYQDGVISEDDVYKTYKDLGYDDWHAKKLTEWTIREATAEDRKLTRSIIEDLYKRQLLTEEEAVKALKDIGYRDEYAQLIIAKARYDKEKKVKDKIINAVRKLYLNGQVDENEAIERLSKINMLANEIDLLIEEWKLEREGMQKHLTLYELKQIAKKGIIDRETFIREAKKIGYSEKYADWIYRSL